ncbi:hypothetical protein BDV96DRAFT_594706 [Lophiotrema nucula]|uniref:OTU domain-containing protein n=1 Tax=Lophiotrema nucula TaxID=690887 RepID=A0A6A5ZRB8_9PLEO|nr:hypothetical protein BDV96DRAFT_594706 [Lophiotrema nucula]
MSRTRKPTTNATEFPLLQSNGLYASEIKGDGNCLFNALSDQLFGHQDKHAELRDATIHHMRVNADYYQQFMVVNPVRRNPKRKVASVATLDVGYHSLEELQQQFNNHLDKMGQAGEWADNMEVVAFASALDVHVRLWQADYFYMFSPREETIRTTSSLARLTIDDDDAEIGDKRPTLNIAYHTWEHYSSVRNIGGPHTGPPQISPNVKQASNNRKRSSEERDDEDIIYRAPKRRSPLPLFDSDSTPEPSEASSDESNGPALSQNGSQSYTIPISPPRPRLILKLRNVRPSPPPEDTLSPATGRSPVEVTSQVTPASPVTAASSV